MGVASKIGEIAKSKGIALKELSRQTDIPYTTLYNAVKRDSKMEFETVKKIADVLGVSWDEFYPGDETDSWVKGWAPQKTDSYKMQLDAACAYLGELLNTAESDSETDWTVEERNNWIKRHIPQTAQKFNLKELDLNDTFQWFLPSEEDWLSRVQESIANFNYFHTERINFKYLEKIIRSFAQMSDEGQAEAAKRVQELTQIPAYQRHAAPVGDSTQSAGTGDEKDPE